MCDATLELIDGRTNMARRPIKLELYEKRIANSIVAEFDGGIEPVVGRKMFFVANRGNLNVRNALEKGTNRVQGRALH